MVWPIDAPKGRFPSKIAHSAARDLIHPAARHTHIPYSTTHAPHTHALLPATAVYPPLRAASAGAAAAPVAADTARCSIAAEVRCSSRHRPLCSLRPLNIRQSRRAWERVGAAFEAQ